MTDAGSSPDLSSDKIKTYLTFAREVICETRALILARADRGFGVEIKSDSSPVTDADREAEQLIRRRVAERFPDHGFVGEEFDSFNPHAALKWIADPIDGTMNFVNGIPTFGTILGLHLNDRPLVGVIDHPRLGLCYSAGLGLGAWCNDRRIDIEDDGRGLMPGRSIVTMSGRPNFLKAQREALFDRFIRSYPNVRIFADCFSHTRAVHGQVGACVSYSQRDWDIAATEILILEAGGRYVELERTEPKPGVRYRAAVFGKPSVVEGVLPFFDGSK